MTQQSSIPQQISHFIQTSSADAYFRGVGNIGGIPSTIVISMEDVIVNLNGFMEGSAIFSGEMRNPSYLQPFNGRIYNPNTGYVTLRTGFPDLIAQLDFTDNQITVTIDPFDDQPLTYFFQYEPTTQSYVQGHRSLPSNFDAAQYGASHPDLITNIGFNLHGLTEHYLYAGQAEGRALDTFDEVAYWAANPDLFSLINSQSLSQNPEVFVRSTIIPHYIQYGFYENRPLTFNSSAYLASNPDVISLVQGDRQNATLHYVLEGYFQGRSVSSFDPKQYLASYPDLVAAFGINLEAATDHFVDYGYFEGRGADNFSEFRYIASHADLIQHFGLDGVGATDHYLNFGLAEGRNPLLFDPFSYMNLNPDVNQAFGGDPLLATQHYIAFGFLEGRVI